MKRVKKENAVEIMKRIKEAGDPANYETSWDEKGIPKSKKKSEIKKGKTSRAKGARFELNVRKDLENKGRIVDKWNNNVDLEKEEMIIAKRKYNPFSKVMTIGTGFPDFISIKRVRDDLYSVIGVEVKMNGILSKVEKAKCKWYLAEHIFLKVLVAKAVKEGRAIKIEYVDFKEKYGE